MTFNILIKLKIACEIYLFFFFTGQAQNQKESTQTSNAARQMKQETSYQCSWKVECCQLQGFSL